MNNKNPTNDPNADQNAVKTIGNKEDSVDFNTIMLPKAMIMDARIPARVIDDLNAYLDALYESEDRRSYAHSLVGQIKQGQQLQMDPEHPAVSVYASALCQLGARYIDAFGSAVGQDYPQSSVQIDSMWSVHSYAGDYNPMHSHASDSFVGLATVLWTRVPKDIHARTDSNLKNASGAADGCLALHYGPTWINDSRMFKVPQNKTMRPMEGQQLLFPNWMEHAVYPFNCEGERRSVVANLNVFPVDNEYDILKKR